MRVSITKEALLKAAREMECSNCSHYAIEAEPLFETPKYAEVEVVGFDIRDGDFALLVRPEISVYAGMKLRELPRVKR